MQADAMELWNGVINIFKDAADTFLPVPPAAEIRENQKTETDEKLFTAEADALASSGDSAKQALAGRQWLQDRNKSWIERNPRQHLLTHLHRSCAVQASLGTLDVARAPENTYFDVSVLHLRFARSPHPSKPSPVARVGTRFG